MEHWTLSNWFHRSRVASPFTCPTMGSLYELILYLKRVVAMLNNSKYMLRLRVVSVIFFLFRNVFFNLSSCRNTSSYNLVSFINELDRFDFYAYLISLDLLVAINCLSIEFTSIFSLFISHYCVSSIMRLGFGHFFVF